MTLKLAKSWRARKIELKLVKAIQQKQLKAKLTAENANI